MTGSRGFIRAYISAVDHSKCNLVYNVFMFFTVMASYSRSDKLFFYFYDKRRWFYTFKEYYVTGSIVVVFSGLVRMCVLVQVVVKNVSEFIYCSHLNV